MELIANVLLGAGALGAAAYCLVLARRLTRFNQLETGMGGAIAVLSAQVDDMTKALQRAQSTASTSSATLTALAERSEKAAERLELLLASMHGLPEPGDGARRLRVVRRRAHHQDLEAAE